MKSIALLLLSLFLSPLAFAQRKQAPQIRLASYNLRLDIASDGINAWPNRKEDVKALIQYHDFDIIGTQEGFQHQLQDICSIPGLAYVGGGRDDGKNAGEHSAIVYKTSRFNILDSGNFWLSETPDVPGKGWDAVCCNRITSWAKFKDKITRKVFYVFNTHFDHEGVVARKESGKLMVAKIKEIAGNTPVVCTGDFNSTPDTEQIEHMSSFMQDAYSVSRMPPYGPVGTFSGFKFTAPLKDRIDYVFVSKHFEVLKYAALSDSKDQRYPSDHMPVVAHLRFVK